MKPNDSWLRVVARWGLLSVALLLALTLVGASIRSLLATRALGATLVQGQADVFFRSVRSMWQSERGVPPEALLQEACNEHRRDGLRYVAVVGPDLRVWSSAGHASRTAPTNLPSPGSVQVIGETVRMVAPPPLPGHPPGASPDRVYPLPLLEGPAGPVFQEPAPGPRALLLVEFEPVLAQRTVRDAHANALIGIIASIVLMGAALVFRRMSIRVEQADAALARQNHLAALGEMSAVLAHEIRNPLTIAKGHAQLLAEQLSEGQRPRRSANRVVDSLIRLERLTSSLLDFSRSAEICRKEQSPGALLREAAQAVHSDRIRVRSDGAPASWSLDPDRMRQVLVNVLENALQSSSINDPVDAVVALRDGMLELSVRDRGKGIEPGQEALSFEPFHTSRVRGTGLGLAIAQRIVHQHGGTIGLSNHPEGGAIVRITLPAA